MRVYVFPYFAPVLLVFTIFPDATKFLSLSVFLLQIHVFLCLRQGKFSVFALSCPEPLVRTNGGETILLLRLLALMFLTA